MNLTTEDLVDSKLVSHTKLVTSNEEQLTYYIDKTQGLNNIQYSKSNNGSIEYIDTINIFNVGHNSSYEAYINESFKKLDSIIDLDFIEMSHNNGSMLDIYQISYSSFFEDNIIGQALAQRNEAGTWWDIFWKDSPETGDIDIQANQNTILHEIGHTLGLSHPFDDPFNKEWNSNDTIMSYNAAPDGWDNWFSQNDLNALIRIWGRENDNGFINFAKNSSQYKYRKSSDNSYFINTDLGSEDITTIENLNFPDKSINVKEEIIEVFDLVEDLNDITGKIYRLYNATFNRFPDKDGLSYWIDQNISGKDNLKITAQSFIKSLEFLDLYGADSSDESFVTSLYSNVLDRLPDSEGFTYWLNQLEKGYEDRSELLIGFSESSENKSIFSIETSIY